MVVCLVVVGGCLSLTAAYYPVVCQPSVATELSAAACSRVCVCVFDVHTRTHCSTPLVFVFDLNVIGVTQDGDS